MGIFITMLGGMMMGIACAPLDPTQFFFVVLGVTIYSIGLVAL